jgi:hypothetical protein
MPASLELLAVAVCGVVAAEALHGSLFVVAAVVDAGVLFACAALLDVAAAGLFDGFAGGT